MFSIISIYIQKNPEGINQTFHLPGPHLLGRVESLSKPHSMFTLVTFVIIVLFMIVLLLKEPHFMPRIANLLPTSGILIILGMLSGIISSAAEEHYENSYTPADMTADIFQHFLIFPILLHASYKLFYNQQFIRQFRSVFILSLIGTFLNVLLTGLLLNATTSMSKYRYASMSITQTIVFASSLSVVDPLAVVAVFKGVFSGAKGNFYLPYSAALFGYGVAMELFKAANALSVFGEDDAIPTSSYLLVALSTLTDPAFGIIIGVTCGFVSAFITRFTSVKCQYFEPLITIGCALFGYVLCVDFGFSYIFATISCGLVQERFTFVNMSPKSSMSTENVIYAISLISELLMFIIIGHLTIYVGFSDVWAFAIATIIIIYITRFLVTLGLSLVLNHFRLSIISFKWQLLIFGGHRGPMSLAMILAYIGPFKWLFRDTTLLVIVFSVIVDGAMCRYLATLLNIRKDYSQSTINNFLTLTSIYGGAEMHNLLGVGMVSNLNNCFHNFERVLVRFLITDKKKLTNVYRKHSTEERREFFEMLEKHDSHSKPDGQKSEHEGQVSQDAVKMEEVTHL